MLLIHQVLMILMCVTSLMARPQAENKDAKAEVLFREDNRDDQSYQYKYESSNGISRAEIGEFEETGFGTGIAVIKGYYSYIGPDNIRYTVTYIADENGFQPKIYKSNANILPAEAIINNAIKIEGIDDDRIGTKLLISLGGGNIG